MAEWKTNIACGSAYKTLANLHQFNPEKLSFDKAGSTKLKRLSYYPSSSSDSEWIETSAVLLTQQYAQMVARNYVLRPQGSATWKEAMKAMRDVLVDGDNTIADFAAAVDDVIRFEDE